MSPPTPPPRYLYKIVPASTPPPSPLPSILPLSSLDANDGFIHLSTSAQIIGTLNRFFPTDSHIHLLRIPYEPVDRFIKWETPDRKEAAGDWNWNVQTSYFPHMYGNAEDGKGCKLGNEEVQDSRTLKKGPEGWKQEDWPFEEDKPSQ